jgi:hypothetical protein
MASQDFARDIASGSGHKGGGQMRVQRSNPGMFCLAHRNVARRSFGNGASQVLTATLSIQLFEE